MAGSVGSLRGERWGVVTAAAVSAALTIVLTAGAWRPGHLLYRDFVSVPDPVVGAQALGIDGTAPRAVPLDLVTAVVDTVVPAALQQQLMLAGSIFLAGLGTALLLRSRGGVAMVAAAAVAIWNPFVAQRLLVGQPPTLLAYSMTPWLVLAVRSRVRPSLRVALVLAAALPAALTPWGGVVAGAVVVGTAVLLPRGPRGRWPIGYAALALLWCLPWAVPAVLGGTGAGDPDGATAFAVGADSWVGTIGSVLTLGGIWAPAARLDSRSGASALTCSLFLLVLAGLGLRRHRRARSAGLVAGGWLVAVLVPLVLSAGPGLAVFRALQPVPGVALLRDTHRLVGFAALAVAVLVGLGAGALAERVPAGAGQPPRALVAVVVVALAVLSAPDFPSRMRAAYQPVTFPGEWAAVVRVAEGAPTRGAVLVLPWQPLRQVGWAGGQPFLDPLPRALTRSVRSSRNLTVVRDGRVLEVDGGDPATGVRWAAGDLSGDALDGIAAVVEWKGTAGTLPAGHPGLVRALEGRDFTVWVRPADTN